MKVCPWSKDLKTKRYDNRGETSTMSSETTMDLSQLTPTQQAIYSVLADGERHLRRKLRSCLPDDLGGPNNIRGHVSNLRKILRVQGHDISTERIEGYTYYRLVRRMANPYDE